MQLWTDLIDPAELTDFARTIAEDADTGPLAALLPSISEDDISFGWNVNEVLVDVAEFRAFDAETPIGNGSLGERKRAELAPLGKKYRFGEYDQLVRRGRNAPETVQAAADKLAARAVRAVIARLTLLRAEALVEGELAINENDFVQTVEFGRAADQTNVVPATLWGASGADPITDLLTWQAAISDASGVEPDRIVMSGRVFRALAAALASGGFVSSDAGVVSREAANDVLVAYGLPTLSVDNTRIGGNAVLPDDAVVMGATGIAGATVWGLSADADEPGYGLAAAGIDAPGLVVGAYKTEDPNTKWIRSDAVALPILSAPSATLSARVL